VAAIHRGPIQQAGQFLQQIFFQQIYQLTQYFSTNLPILTIFLQHILPVLNPNAEK
jgi:hypothetical protein